MHLHDLTDDKLQQATATMRANLQLLTDLGLVTHAQRESVPHHVHTSTPGHHNLPCLGIRGEVGRDKDLVFEVEKNASAAALSKQEPTLPIDLHPELSAQRGETRCGVSRPAIGVGTHAVDGGASAAHRRGDLDRVADPFRAAFPRRAARFAASVA